MRLDAPPLVEATGLHVFYGTSHILRGIDFSVRSGETVGLLGRNGMGKTTLLRALMGLTPPRSGRVSFAGHDVTGLPTNRISRAGIAYVPEGRGIFPNLSVRENLIMAARPGPDGRVDWSFDRVMTTFPRLSRRLNHGGAQLSGGEQQMLTIGRALMTNPTVLLLDEATEGLAPLVMREIWSVVRAIREAGVAVVVVDKNHAEVTAVADSCVVLVKGSVVYSGPSEGLRQRSDVLIQHLGV